MSAYTRVESDAHQSPLIVVITGNLTTALSVPCFEVDNIIFVPLQNSKFDRLLDITGIATVLEEIVKVLLVFVTPLPVVFK